MAKFTDQVIQSARECGSVDQNVGPHNVPYYFTFNKHQIEAFARYWMVQSWWRRMLGMKYCAVICHKCEQITGWERP